MYPLRALIADQAYHLNSAMFPFGVSSAVLTGESTPEERTHIFKGLAAGDVDIILTTPEFLNFHVKEFAKTGRIGFVAVDEAHHIGQAKAGNRMAYRTLDAALRELGNPTVLALTATANNETARMIENQLSISAHVYDDTARPNLHIDDRRNLRNRDDYLAHIVARGEKTIVYVSSREQSVSVARALRKRVPQLASRIGFYNGGLSRAERNQAEKLFRTDAFCVLVATSAFGEGVNIPHIRRVVLYNLPLNEVEFNQMSGRAGRDGKPAVVHLLYGKADVQTNQSILFDATPDREVLANVYRHLRALQAQAGDCAFALNLDDYAPSNPNAALGLTSAAVKCGLEVFRELGFIEAHRACFSRERIWSVLVKPSASRADLLESVRFREGLGEIEEFDGFRAWALQSDASTLLEHITHPIVPQFKDE